MGDAFDHKFPIALKPKPNEIFSSWLARVALNHGVPLNALIVDMYGDLYFYRRDIDIYADHSVVARLARCTETDLGAAVATSVLNTLEKFTKITENRKEIEWVTHANNIYSAKINNGMTFCPLCFEEDQEPYFRMQWRLSFYTVCPKHQCLLLHYCPKCKSEVSLYKLTCGENDLAVCWHCKVALKGTTANRSHCYTDYLAIQQSLSELIDLSVGGSSEEMIHIKEYFNALYRYCHYIAFKLSDKYNNKHSSHWVTHKRLDTFSPIDRLLIISIAFQVLSSKFECNFKRHIHLQSSERITDLHMRQATPCGRWCKEHDYLNISHNCTELLEKYLKKLVPIELAKLKALR